MRGARGAGRGPSRGSTAAGAVARRRELTQDHGGRAKEATQLPAASAKGVDRQLPTPEDERGLAEDCGFVATQHELMHFKRLTQAADSKRLKKKKHINSSIPKRPRPISCSSTASATCFRDLVFGRRRSRARWPALPMTCRARRSYTRQVARGAACGADGRADGRADGKARPVVLWQSTPLPLPFDPTPSPHFLSQNHCFRGNLFHLWPRAFLEDLDPES